MASRDIVVVGASAGGVEPLKALVGGLPADFPGSVFVVLHVPPHSPSALPAILSRSGPLEAAHPQDGESVRPGRIYVAPPDHHLLVEHGGVLVRRGPKENRSRPSVDALFRSAAYAYGPRVAGVVLSGTLDDGTPGLWAVKRLGGAALVQQPEDCLFADMPRNALEQVEVDHAVPAAELGGLLARLAREEAPAGPGVTEEELERLALEVRIAVEDDAFERGIMGAGELTPFTCPECHGALVRLKDGLLDRFRCHTGHAFTPGSLLAEVSESVEGTLWQAMRGLEEATMLLRHIGRSFEQGGRPQIASLFLSKAREVEQQARVVHDSLPRHEQLSTDIRHRSEADPAAQA